MTRTRRTLAALAAAAALVILPACDASPPSSGGGDTTSALGGLDHINHLHPKGPSDGRIWWSVAVLGGAVALAAARRPGQTR